MMKMHNWVGEPGDQVFTCSVCGQTTKYCTAVCPGVPYGNDYMYRDKNGYAVPPLSDCCRAQIVYYRPDAAAFVPWHGWWDVELDRLRCERCDRPCKPAPPKSAVDSEVEDTEKGSQ